MVREIRCDQDLGIQDCSFVARGATPGDVVEHMVEHLRQNHDLDTPEADEILEGDYNLQLLDDGVRLVIERLNQALDIEPLDEGTDPNSAFDTRPL